MNVIKKIGVSLALVGVSLTIIAQNNMENMLSKKEQSFVVMAAFTAKGDLENLKSAINEGLDNGLTVNQTKEALAHLYAYLGFPRSLNALGTLENVLKERKEKGINDEMGEDPSPLPADYNSLAQGTKVQTQLRGGKPFTYQFSPSTDYYLKAHLFGDIFARDILTFDQRELVTIGALASLKGAEPQLKSHVAGSRNMGVTNDKLRAIPSTLNEKVGELEAYRAKKAVSEVLGDTFKDGQPVENQIFPKGVPNTAYAKYFVGESFLAPLLKGEVSMSNVTFEPRCRNNWHIHHKASQILICVGGDGWYQEWGKPAQKLHAGDVVNIPAEVKHWHGATADSWFQHISVSVPNPEASNEWLDPVTDEEYNSLQ